MTKEFNKVYKQEAAFVWNYLRRMGIPLRDLEDAVHDVFVVMFKKYDSFDASRPIRPWLCGIAVKIASEYKRRAYNRREGMTANTYTQVDDGSIEYSDGGGGTADSVCYHPEWTLQQANERNMVMNALEVLGEQQRNVFVLHDMEGYSIPEIEEITLIPLNTLYSQLRLARKKFVAAIRQQQALRGEK